MGRLKTLPESEERRPTRKSLTPEGRENQLIALAIDRVEERMLKGEASSAEYVHFLKLASSKERLEKEKMELEKELLQAKTEALKSAKKTEELYREAIKAMNLYSGKGGYEEDYDEDE